MPLGIGLLPLGDHEGRGGRGAFFLGFPYKDKSDRKAIKKCNVLLSHILATAVLSFTLRLPKKLHIFCDLIPINPNKCLCKKVFSAGTVCLQT